MKVINSTSLIILVTMALSMITLTLAARDLGHEQQTRSRFLTNQMENGNSPRNFWFCQKENDTCDTKFFKNGTCCHHFCVDLNYNFYNCGACDKMCSLLETCCGGECLNLGFDDNNCGACNHKCKPGSKCVHGMCGYA